MYGFSAKSNSRPLNIFGLLMRYLTQIKDSRKCTKKTFDDMI